MADMKKIENKFAHLGPVVFAGRGVAVAWRRLGLDTSVPEI